MNTVKRFSEKERAHDAYQAREDAMGQIEAALAEVARLQALLRGAQLPSDA